MGVSRESGERWLRDGDARQVPDGASRWSATHLAQLRAEGVLRLGGGLQIALHARELDKNLRLLRRCAEVKGATAQLLLEDIDLQALRILNYNI